MERKISFDEKLLSEKIYVTLRDAIICGKFKPRERLTTANLADLLGVSRTPVRVALDMLSLEGLVDIVPHRGTFVSDLFSDDLEEIYLMRSVLEGLAARMAVKHITDDDIAKLEEVIGKYEQAIAANDGNLIVKLNTEFHLSIAFASNKRRLSSEIKRLYDYCIRYRILSLNEPQNPWKSYTGHKEILDAIKLRDPDLAEQRIRQHLSKAPSFIYDVLVKIEKQSSLERIGDVPIFKG